MLKSLLINKKKIPIPVPLKSLKDVLAWISDHLLGKDHSVTRVRIDHEEVDLYEEAKWVKILLKDDSLLEIQIDSPLEIAAQTLDAAKNLCLILERSLKPLAVYLWQYQEAIEPTQLDQVESDLIMIDELLDHGFIILEKSLDISLALSYRSALESSYKAMLIAKDNKDWRALARILLQQIESKLNELSGELGSLQKTIYELIAQDKFCPSQAFTG